LELGAQEISLPAPFTLLLRWLFFFHSRNSCGKRAHSFFSLATIAFRFRVRPFADYVFPLAVFALVLSWLALSPVFWNERADQLSFGTVVASRGRVGSSAKQLVFLARLTFFAWRLFHPM
jgi:hypothetical protein